ncbi:AAA family ATPase [Nocardioides marinquilinus]
MKRIEERLNARGSSRSSGNDFYCPVHETDGRSHSASLTVKRGDEPGQIIMRCARCPTDDVLDLLGLTYADLHYDDVPREKLGTPVYFDYPDRDGKPHLRVVRQRFTSGRPDTHQEHWTGSRWRKGLGEPQRERVLYRLPHVLKAVRKGRTIHLTEGESDADALNKWFKANKQKAFATTHPEGAGKWRDAYLASLAGAARVVVWADRDAPGYACAAQRFASLQNAAHAVEFRLPIPDEPKADVRDHLAAGHRPDDGEIVTLAELEALTHTANDEDDAAVTRALEKLRVNERARDLHRAEKADREFRAPASDLDLAAALARPREPLSYTIDRLHPTGSNSLIAAQYKVGKTTLMANLLKSYADGDKFLGEFTVEPGPGRIAFFNYELTDSMLYDEYLVPMGIENTGRVAVLNLRGANFDLRSPAAFDFAVSWLQERNCDALILDPFGAAARLNNENDNSEARNWLLGILDPLKAAASLNDLWMPAHTGRGQSEEGQEHARGASAVDDWADVRWTYTKASVTEDDRTVWRRYLSAHGRAVDVPERELAYDTDDHSLYVSQYRSRSQVRTEKGLPDLIRIVSENPGINASALKKALSVGNRDKGRLIALAVNAGAVRVEEGSNNSKLYYPVEAVDA